MVVSTTSALTPTMASKVLQITRTFVSNRKLDLRPTRRTTDAIFDLARKIADLFPDIGDRIPIAIQLGSLVAPELASLGPHGLESADLGDPTDVEEIADRFSSLLLKVEPESWAPILQAFQFATDTRVLREGRDSLQLMAGISAYLAKVAGPGTPFYLSAPKTAEITGFSERHVFDLINVLIGLRLLTVVGEAKPRRMSRTLSFDLNHPNIVEATRNWLLG